MKKKWYIKPRVDIGRLAAYNLVLGMEIETIYGNLGNIDSQTLTSVLRQLNDWLLLGWR